MLTLPNPLGRVLGVGRQFTTQVTVSLVATLCVSALFTTGKGPVAVPPPVDNGKSIQRVADGTVETTVVRYDAQQQAALASIASFTPAAAPTPVPAVVAARAAAPAKQAINVLPPPRPATLTIASVPTPLAPTVVSARAAPAADGWQIAGVEIPGSAKLRRIVPTGADIARTGDEAWAASTKAFKKVAGLGSLFGL